MLLTAFDNRFRENGYETLCGVDEAGRGPLAGPVFAAAVVLPAGLVIDGLRDSKTLSHLQRERLYEVIVRDAVSWCVASASVEEIELHNILGASLLAMRRAVEGLSVLPDCALVDGNRDPGLAVETALLVKGDAKSASIAAASVLAKVSRDRLMAELDLEYPAYRFAVHKGYPTKLHYEMLDLHGPCPAHRQFFLTKWESRHAGAGAV